MGHLQTRGNNEGVPLIHWRAVFGGVVIGLGLLIMVSALWVALAVGSGVEAIQGNLQWYVGGTLIFALFMGGFLAGWLSGVRGPVAGIMNGITLWGLLVALVLVIGVPTLLGLPQSVDATNLFDEQTTVWATFWSILVAFVTAGLGGLLGGSIPRSEATVAGSTVGHAGHDHDSHDHDQRDRDHDRDEDRTEELGTRHAS